MEDTSRSTTDPFHPYYLDESEIPGTGLVNSDSVFDGSGYGVWRRLVLLALTVKNKVGFVDGSCPMPSAESPLLGAWIRCDAMVMSWILNSLSNEIATSVIYSETAKDMWHKLELRFDEPYGLKMFRLYKELVGLKQGSSGIATYFTKLSSIWNELDSLNIHMKCISECKCGAKLQFYKAEEDKKLFQFLMGLNESYDRVRGRILMMSPLPSLYQAYSLLLQEERLQTEVQSGQKMKNDARKMNVECNYCKKQGHTIDKCYKIHGFPAHFNKIK
ncbi:PREDICTED: uncharacterized protein LOC109213806 [Nicotiana attenuata]|uniref:uncharacterized protein LOC109213806 n=1 Tax=Nicotiana attenuata TaxID=49451 RepID=UPI0009050640|nr:PREDICTED: uncharacterized protein LOC109213806 [Nicotiana attenuata]